ncbi:uncharacterized protein ALTATR162_LOCUS367 [Alternaria atra]|uniref:Uncharacterized protein n=1 Tax=Alternaria atra TaxID=119953 RepID=A0A8J2HUQ9_9PLEO|nr:uncharacterized protein ALTATR162_LOCUS367 [Alternaria atra]CAG5138465.1 unnamed protein product [Alternaria atra]
MERVSVWHEGYILGCFRAGCALFRLQIFNPVYILSQVFATYHHRLSLSTVYKSKLDVKMPFFAIRVWLVAVAQPGFAVPTFSSRLIIKDILFSTVDWVHCRRLFRA